MQRCIVFLSRSYCCASLILLILLHCIVDSFLLYGFPLIGFFDYCLFCISSLIGLGLLSTYGPSSIIKLQVLTLHIFSFLVICILLTSAKIARLNFSLVLLYSSFRHSFYTTHTFFYKKNNSKEHKALYNISFTINKYYKLHEWCALKQNVISNYIYFFL